MKPDELKPCPFCGSNARLLDSSLCRIWVNCNKCGAASEMFGTKDEAIAAWNRRQPEQVREETGRMDKTKCPACGGKADNGFDRCVPPNPYLCSKCENAQQSKASCEGCWNVDNDSVICEYCSRGEKTDHFEKRPED